MKKLLFIIFLLSYTFTWAQHKSIMQEQQHYYDSLGIKANEYYKLNHPAQTVKSTAKACTLNKVVFGWHPYWSNGYEANYRWDLLSDFVYFSYEINASTGNAVTTHDWLTTSSVTTAQNNGARIHLCATLFSDHSTFLGSSTAKQTFINNIIDLLKQRNANGVNIDFEAVSSSLKDQLTAFLIDLANQVHQEIPGAIVSIDLPAVDWGGVFDVAALKDYIDWFFIMGYDYYWSGSSTAGPVGPMFDLTSSYDYNQSKSITYYLSKGVPANQLALGVPYYGREWPVDDPAVPASTTGSGVSMLYKTVRNNPSTYFSKQWEPKSFTPYYVYYDNTNSTWRQCFIDDDRSLRYRYDLVNRRGLLGIGIWALGYDDGYAELWQAIEDKLTSCAVTPCTDTIFDIGGGPYWDYYAREDYTYTIAPDNATNVTLTFSQLDLESGYDSLWIYDGTSTSGELLAALSGNTLPSPIKSQSGAITIKFHSDGATQGAGYQAVWECNKFVEPCILLSADFSYGLPSGWKNIVLPDGDLAYKWSFDNPGNRDIDPTYMVGRFAILDDDYFEDNGKKTHAALVSDTIDCSQVSEIYLEFNHFFRHSVNNPADAYLEISTDGTNWTVLDHWRDADDGPARKIYDISSYAAGQSMVLIRWRYEDDYNWSNYWAIDNVEVRAKLQGFYTVKPDGTGDYQTITQVFESLEDCGVGPGGVTFLIAPNYTYTDIPDTITFSTTADRPVILTSADTTQPNPVFARQGTASDSDAVLRLMGCDYLTFDHIDFKAADNTVEFGVYVGNSSSTNGATHLTIKNSKITLFNTNLNSVGINQDTTYIPTAVSGANSYNQYINIEVANAYSGIFLHGLDDYSDYRDDSCIVANCTIHDFGYSGATNRAMGIHFSGETNIKVTGNTFYNGTTNSRTYGIYSAGHNEAQIERNTVYGLYGTGIHVVGIRSYLSEDNILRNKIYSIEGTIMSSGIESYASEDTIANNFVFDIKAPQADAVANGYPGARSISLRETHASVYYNTTYMNYTSENTNNECAGIYIQNSYTDSRNNIFINTSDMSNGRLAAAIYFKYTADLSDKYNAQSGHNLFYTLATPTTKNPIAYIAESSTIATTLNDYLNNASPKEDESISEMPQFVNLSTLPYDLHIDPNSTPALEDAGTPVAITTDFDGQTRSTTPDIGADEFYHYLLWTGNSSEDWNTAANWNPNILPSTLYDVRISQENKEPVITSQAVCKNLIIDNNASVTIASNGILKPAGTITNNAGVNGIVIKNNATGSGSLIYNNAVEGTMELYLTGDKWHYISSPVTSANIDIFMPANIYYYDETKADWWTDGQMQGESGWVKISDGTMQPTGGYAYYGYTKNVVIQGTFNYGDQQINNLSFTHYDNIDDQYAGWHLIGNPYPAYIDWYAGTENGYITLSGIDNTIYYYDDLIDNYRYFNGNLNAGDAGFTGSLNEGSQFIPPAQGFYVHANTNGASLTLSQDALSGSNIPVYKKQAKTQMQYIVLQAQYNGNTDQTAIIGLADATLGFDPKYDAYKLFSQSREVPQIYTTDDTNQYAINVLPQIDTDTTIVIKLVAGQEADYTIKLSKDNLTKNISIENPQTGKITDLKKGDYVFHAQAGEQTLLLHIGSSKSEDNITEQTANTDFKIYPNPTNGITNIVGMEEGQKEIRVFDISGKTVFSVKTDARATTLYLNNLQPGIYFISVDGQEPQKLIIRKN